MQIHASTRFVFRSVSGVRSSWLHPGWGKGTFDESSSQAAGFPSKRLDSIIFMWTCGYGPRAYSTRIYSIMHKAVVAEAAEYGVV